MTNRYKALTPITLAGVDYQPGDTFEHEFPTPDAEWSQLDRGLLELQPNTYQVTGTTPIYEHPPGSTFELALPLGQEQHLVQAGHIKRL